MPDFPTIQYSQIIDQLQTGDLVLFSGATSSGALIKIFDGALFSHIGIVRFSLALLPSLVFFPSTVHVSPEKPSLALGCVVMGDYTVPWKVCFVASQRTAWCLH